MSEAPEFDLELVEKELRGEASLSESRLLESNPVLWRNHLGNVLRHIDYQMLDRKNKSYEKGVWNQVAITEYQNWKAGAARFKWKAQRKIQEVKQLMSSETARKEAERRAAGTRSNDKRMMAPILEEILQELRHISEMLSSRSSVLKDSKL